MRWRPWPASLGSSRPQKSLTSRGMSLLLMLISRIPAGKRSMPILLSPEPLTTIVSFLWVCRAGTRRKQR